MKITFFDSKVYDQEWFEPKAEQYGYEMKFYKTRLRPDTVMLAKDSDLVCVFVNDEVNRVVIDKLTEYGVKGILLRCAGFNNVDLEAAKGRIPVLRVPSYSPEAVAEFAMAQLLCICRKLHRAYNRTRDFNMSIQGLMGRDFYGKTIGIIGTGKIGQAMIRICEGFHMQILAYDLYPNDKLQVEYVDLETLFKQSDFISLHCPLTTETKYLINAHSLEMMKQGVYLVNTSRGELIKTSDLIEMLLIPKRIGGVALDVYEEEEGVFYEDRSNDVITDHNLARLMTFPNVLVTSHQGYFTEEAMEAICRVTLENARAIENREELKNAVVI